MRKYGMTCVIAWAVLLASPLPSRAGTSAGVAISVIANKAIKIKSISRDELRPLFQTKNTTLADGTSARPFNLPETDRLRQGFDAAVLGLDPDRVARYWIDRKIRGGERPPQTAPSGAVMVKVVSKTPGAIGYVESALVDASVTVVAKVIDGQVVAP
jgi:ABC-type phosphate transport system substrate-binding protein